MSWRDKVDSNELCLFCSEWKSTKDIKEHFELSTVEAYHCMKFVRGLPHDFETIDRFGTTSRSYAVKTKARVLMEIRMNSNSNK